MPKTIKQTQDTDMHVSLTNLNCKNPQCGKPLDAARMKAPTQGWYCVTCYAAIFVLGTLTPSQPERYRI